MPSRLHRISPTHICIAALHNTPHHTPHQATTSHTTPGGIYIQEPDASPANVDALCALVNHQPIYLPLGFAFGNVSGTTAAFADLQGRGFAAQQLLEELAAKKELGAKVCGVLV